MEYNMNLDSKRTMTDEKTKGISGRRFLTTLIIMALLAWLGTSLFIVQETETAIVTRFSSPLERIYSPGIHLKLPFPFDGVIRFNSRLLVFDHEPTEFLTQDKKNILIDTFAVWRIVDEHRFLSTVRNRQGAEARLLDMITSVIGDTIGRYPLENFINTMETKVKLAEIDQKILLPCKTSARSSFGIELLDVRINSFNFPDQNRQSVIRRMQAERYRIATQYRSEGDEEARKIEAATDYEVRKLLAEANREAQSIRGEAEAKAMRIYGEAYSADPDFYNFLRTLEVYVNVVDANTTLLLSSDSRLWQMIERGEP